jgi:hypothetical protein
MTAPHSISKREWNRGIDSQVLSFRNKTGGKHDVGQRDSSVGLAGNPLPKWFL